MITVEQLRRKAKAYDEAIERARKIHNDTEFDYERGMMEEIFPELSESEDERIRKWIIENIQETLDVDGFFEGQKTMAKNAIVWLEKQGTERKQLYVRFGDIPPNEKSKIYRGEEKIGDENGVSVYPAFELNGNIVLGLTLPITRTTLYTQQYLLEYDNRPCYLVSGDYVGKGTDGEPLIRNISIIKRLDNYRIKEDEKQGEQKPFDYEGANIQQKDFAPKVDMPRYSIGDVLCDKSCTTLGKEEQPNFEITDIRNGMYICDKCSFPISQQDEYELVAKRIEPQSAWGEEDGKNLEGIIDEIEANKNNAPDYDLATYDRFLDWLKSLKDRVQPKSQWKPSEEQLNNILDVLSFDNCTPKRRELLESLYKQLKKL